jgi:hypothetical protein
MSIGLPLVTWKGTALVPLWITWLVAGFFVYACVSLAWAPNPLTGLSTIWQLALLAGAFYAGAQLPNLRMLAKGLALGFGISSLLTLAQVLGFNVVPEFILCRPSGLTFNPIILGEGCALTTLLLLSNRQWLLAMPLLPGLVLAQSRAALLALAVGIVIGWCRIPRRAVFSIAPLWAACSIFDIFSRGDSDNLRMVIWRVLYHFLNFWGHGAGSIESIVIHYQDRLLAPTFAHNEFLDLAFQFGIGAVPAALLLLAPLLCTQRKEWPCYVGFLVCCIFSFPLHAPPLAFLGMVVAGSLCRDWNLAWVSLRDRRYRLALQPTYPSAGSNALAIQLEPH